MEQTTDAYMLIPEVHGVFVDAILTDEASNLVFVNLVALGSGIQLQFSSYIRERVHVRKL